ncbi:MAG: DUF1016 domain-containing protein, partial [Cytophagales bacterium]|nr:DUF1016 domain-containing protein [Cytophagales bacterium]
MQVLQHQGELFEQIKTLLQEARKQIVKSVNRAMVYTYFEIGRLIVENEQHGSKRAAYGKETLENVSQRLTDEFGRG